MRRLALALAAVAGFVDVVGYLTLHHLFTAHMTGNASKLGVALGHGDLWAALPLAVAPGFFVVGIAAGTALLDAGSRAAALLVEAVLVAAYMGYGHTVIHRGVVPDHSLAGFYVLAALATVGLGVQSAALTAIDSSTVRTTYVSGLLTNLAQAGTRRLTGAGSGRHSLRLLAALWFAYVAGATLGSYGLRQLTVWCLAIPLGVLLISSAALRALPATERSGRP